MIKVSADYVLTESRLSRAPGKGSAYIMLSSVHKKKPSSILLPDRVREHIQKSGSLAPSNEVCVALFHNDFSSGAADEVGWQLTLGEVDESLVFHHNS